MSTRIETDVALDRLVKGNRRYVAGKSTMEIGDARRDTVAGGQSPFAAVLGCADSRVPPEIVFDQGLGDLFTVRVAGTIATPAQIGSLEFAVDRFGTRLLVVLAHTGCGAVRATLDLLDNPVEVSPNLEAIARVLRPNLEPLWHDDRETALAQGVRACCRATVDQLRDVPALAACIRDDGLKIVGAEYALATGEVDFFYGLD